MVGRFVARLEHRDWDFLEGLGDSKPFDGVIIKASYLAPYPESHPRDDGPPERLRETVVNHGIAWVLDPATAPHLHHQAASWTSPRAARCPMAEAIGLPYSLDRLCDPDSAAALMEAAQSIQLHSQAMTAPYIEIDGIDERRLKANCRLVELAAEVAGDRRVVAFLQSTIRPAMSGATAEAADALVRAGAQTVIIRIRGLDSEAAEKEKILAYMNLNQRIRNAGARAFPDSAGRLGPALVAAGAYGFTSGALYYRKVPSALLSKPSDSGGGAALLYECTDALAGARPGAVPAESMACDVVGCEADGGNGDEMAIRAHNLHEFRRRSRQAAEEGFAYADTLRSMGGELAMACAAALDDFQRERRRAA